jgi:hypothetical protein
MTKEARMAVRSFWLKVCCAVACLAAATVSMAQGRPDTEALLSAQREAMRALSRMDGVWRGESRIVLPNGQTRAGIQTERIGPMLGGTIKVIEGRGYDAQGGVAFNAFGIVSFDAASKGYSMRSYAQGHAGDFVFQPTPDGYKWELPLGPATIRYTATIQGDTLHEIGERIAAGAEPQRIFEMTLKRVGDSDWPSAGAISPR